MTGRLVLCSTPIGNLGDVSRRLVETLDTAEIVYAEDTRRARTLLTHVGVTTPVRSYFVGNEAERSSEVAERLERGETVALISDAGSPGVADPGVSAVRAARQVGATVSVVPGPSAVTAAMAVSGLGGDRFSFEGFLPRRGASRTRRVDEMVDRDHPVVFFTTGPRIVEDLGDLAAAGADRPIVVCRELTKAFEEVWEGRLALAATHWETATRKGEFTVVLGAAPEPGPVSLDEAVALARSRVAAGEKISTVARDVARGTGVDRGDLYDALASSPRHD